MNRDDIIRMAREAGLYVGTNLSGVALVGHAKHNGLLIHTDVDDIERLVQAAYAAGAAAEREECAEVAEGFDACDPKHIAAAIRARGNT